MENRHFKWKVMRDAVFIISLLPEPPERWGIVGSFPQFERGANDIDICLIYREKKDWMRDKKVWVKGWTIPFDLFFYVPHNEEAKRVAIGLFSWEDKEIGNIDLPYLKVTRELIY